MCLYCIYIYIPQQTRTNLVLVLKCDGLLCCDIRNNADKTLAAHEAYKYRSAYITLKDHNVNLIGKLPCRLINPAKSEVEIVLKKYLENINSNVLKCTGGKQWRNSQIVIEWFMAIPNKSKARFNKFSKYPSINQSLLESALNFAQTKTTISDEAIEAFKFARKSLLFNQVDIWIKKDNMPFFDITRDHTFVNWLVYTC